MSKYFTKYENANQSFTKGLILISPSLNAVNDKIKEIAACYDEREVVYVYPGQIRIDKVKAFSCNNFINKHTKLIVLLDVKKFEQIDVFPYIADGIPVKYNHYDELVKIKPHFLVACEMTNDNSILKNFGYSVKKRKRVKPFASLYVRFDLLDCDIEAKEKFMREPVIITKKHSDFDKLIAGIRISLEVNGGCKGNHDCFNESCDKWELIMGYKIDREKTLEYLKSRGGYCDCEILMNAVDHHSDNIKNNIRPSNILAFLAIDHHSDNKKNNSHE